MLLVVNLAAGALAKDPPARPSADTVTRVALLDWTAPVPRAWIAEPPKTSMRLAQFQVPGAGGAAAAELVVFYFGAGEGGSAEANIARWQSQFSGPAGKPVKPAVQHFEVKGMPVTVAELTGTYARSLGMGPPASPTPDQTLLAAVVESPRGNLTFELHGSRASVAANRVPFLAMVRGIR
jgi:hypothetical protein